MDGASPLTVIVVVVLLAAGVAALVVMSFVGGTRPGLALQQVKGETGATAFEVTDVHGGLDWNGLTLQFIDPAGVDHADLYLSPPNGTVQFGDQIQLLSQPPGGTYLLRILDGDVELARVAPTF